MDIVRMLTMCVKGRDYIHDLHTLTNTIMLRAANFVAYLPRSLLMLLIVWPLKWVRLLFYFTSLLSPIPS